MFSRRTFQDAAEQEAALPGWRQRYTQLSPGVFEGEVTLLRLGDMMLIREQMNVCLEQVYLPPANSITLFSHAARSGGFHVQGVYYPGCTIGYDCGHSESLIITRPQADIMMLAVDAASLAPAPRGAIGIFGPRTGRRAQDLFLWLGTLLEMYGAAGPSMPADVGVLLPDLVRDRLTLLLDDGDEQVHGAAGEERRIYCQCMEWLEAHANTPVTVTELATALRLPHRRLRDACLYATGHRLDSIMMLHRLNGAHRALLAARETRRKVSDVALDWGFFHWGRFAVRYHELFGKTPSQTIRAA